MSKENNAIETIRDKYKNYTINGQLINVMTCKHTLAQVVSGTGSINLGHQSVIPSVKSDREVFWANILVARSEYGGKEYRVVENPDDSSGKPDVLLHSDTGTIGIQVTELTHETERKYRHIATIFRKHIFTTVINKKVYPIKPIIVTLFVREGFPPRVSDASKIAYDIANKLLGGQLEASVDVDGYYYTIRVLDDNHIYYCRSVNNIGILINFELLHRSIPFYQKAIDEIKRKKMRSQADWLLIWCIEFHPHIPFFKDFILLYLKEQFVYNPAKRLYLVTALDKARGDFGRHIAVHKIY